MELKDMNGQSKSLDVHVRLWDENLPREQFDKLVVESEIVMPKVK